MTKNNKQTVGTTVSFLNDVTNIIEGYIEINHTRPVAVFKLMPKINVTVAEESELQNAVSDFQAVLTGLKSGEQVQILVKTKPYNTDKRYKLYNDMSDKAQEAFRKQYEEAVSKKDKQQADRVQDLISDNYIKNKYPDYLKKWLDTFIGLNNVSDYEFYLLYSYIKQGVDLSEVNQGNKQQETDLAGVFIKNKNFVENNKQIFINRLSRIVDLDPLADTEISALIEDCVNDKTAGNIESRSANLYNLARSPIERNNNYLKVGEDYTKTLYITDVPPANRFGFLYNMFLSGHSFRISLFFEGINQETVKKKLEREMKTASAALGAKNTPNYAAKELADRYDQLLTLSAAGRVSFVKFSAYLTLIEKDLQDLNDAVSFAGSLFSGLPYHKGSYEQVPCFKSSLPLNCNYGGHGYTVSTDEAATLFPFFKFDVSTTEGGLFLGTNLANQPVWYYPWSEDFTNGNLCVFGIPGSGKSFFNNSLLINLGAWDLDVFIVDKSKSYEFLSAMNKGQYIRIDLEGKYCLNIFECADYDRELTDDNDINEQGEISANKIAAIVGFFKTLLSEDTGGFDKLDRSLIESIINETYKKMKIKDGKIQTDTIPTLSDFQQAIEAVIKEKAEWKSQLSIIKEKLNPYVKNGQYANLTDRPTNVNISSHFIVFDTSGLPEDEDLQSLAVFIINTFLMKKFKQNKKKHRRQILVLDETWSLARFEAGVQFLLNLAKRSRHMGLVCIFASQQIGDFLSNPDAEKVIKSVENQILFKPAKPDIENLAKLNELNDSQKGILSSLYQKKGEFSQCLTLMGKLGSNLMYVRPNPALYWISTTDPKKDVPKRDELLKSTDYNYELTLQNLIGE